MTWLKDQNAGPQGAAREALLKQRAAIVQQIEELKQAPLRSKTMAAVNGRQEDLIALAKLIVSIDKKLGRV